jgi:hypothetical protein
MVIATLVILSYKLVFMDFNNMDIDNMQKILMRLEPKTVSSIQVYNKDNDFRIGYTIAIYNRWKKIICIFQDYENLSTYRMNILLKSAKKIPYTLHITYPKENFTRVGWKAKDKR